MEGGVTTAALWIAATVIVTAMWPQNHTEKSGKGLPMPTVILKLLALSGVISAGCFAVWKANTELQPIETADPTQFTALEGEAKDGVGLGGQPISQSVGSRTIDEETELADDKSLALADPAFSRNAITEDEPTPRGMPAAFPTEQEEPALTSEAPEQTEPEPDVASLEVLEKAEASVPAARVRTPGGAAAKTSALDPSSLRKLQAEVGAPALIRIPNSAASTGVSRSSAPGRVIAASADDLAQSEPTPEAAEGPAAPGDLSEQAEDSQIVTAANEVGAEETGDQPLGAGGPGELTIPPAGRTRPAPGAVEEEENPFDTQAPELTTEPEAVEQPQPAEMDPTDNPFGNRDRSSIPTPVGQDEPETTIDEPATLPVPPNQRPVRTPKNTHAIDETLDPTPTDRSTIPTKVLPPRSVTPDMLSGDATIDDPLMSPTQQPQLRIEKRAQPEAEVGEKFVYEIIVKNVGAAPAQYVVVEERIPKGCDMKRSVPQATIGRTKTLSWNLGTLAPNAEKVIRVEVVPTEAGPIGSVATVRFAAQVATRTVVTAPTLSLSIQHPPEVAVGEVVPVKFTITNKGTGIARKASLRAVLEQGLVHPAGLDIDKELGTLAPGEAKEIELKLTASQPGPFAPTVAIYTNGIDKADGAGYSGGIEQENRTLKLSVIESRLTLTREGHVRRFVNRPADFVTTVKNHSVETMKNVRITEQLPVGVTPVGEAGKFRWNPEDRTVSWLVSELRPGDHSDLRLSVVSARAGMLQGKVQAVSDSGYSAELPTELEVQGFASLTLDFQGDGKAVAVGDQVSMRVTVGNKGSAPAKQVQAMFELPPQMKFVAATGEGDQGPVKFTEDGKYVTFDPVHELAPNEKQTFDIVLIAAEEGTSRVGVELLSTDLPQSLHQQEPVTITPQ